MRDWIRPAVLKPAVWAAAATAFASYSRIVLWFDRPEQLAVLASLIFFLSFVLWGFVLAWHEKYSGRPVLVPQWEPALWLAVTACGAIGAVSMHHFIDPALRPLLPENYPQSLEKLAAMTLFTAAFAQLFLCFAPMAFFLRLFRSTPQSILLTVLVGIFVVFMKLSPLRLPLSLLVCLLAVRGLSGYLAVFFYMRGGVLAAWWWVVLLEARHLLALTAN
ncbi:MAG: hypothetical protein ABIJ96_04740 [Elusimicrobiota bacterium]